MRFKLDTEKRNLLRLAIVRNHRQAILLQQKVKVIQQVKLELAFLQVTKKITQEDCNELLSKYNRQLEALYKEFSWKALEQELKGHNNKPCK